MITSTGNPRIRNVVQLMTSAKTRREQKSYVIEGLKLFEEAPVEQMRQVFLTEAALEKARQIRPEVAGWVMNAPMLNLRGPACELVSDEVFKRMSDTRTPQGVLCVMTMPEQSMTELINKTCRERLEENKLILVLEGIQDPGNLGTMLRTAEAAGVSFLLADRQTADLYNPKVIRSTMGAIYRIPVIYTEHLSASLNELKAAGVRLGAAHLKGKRSYWSEVFPKKTAILIGNEGSGLSDEVTRLADFLVKIPMQGEVESLNAAIAAGLLMYEYRRQHH